MSVCIYTQGRIKPYDHALKVVGFLRLALCTIIIIFWWFYMTNLYDQLFVTCMIVMKIEVFYSSLKKYWANFNQTWHKTFSSFLNAIFRGGLEEKL